MFVDRLDAGRQLARALERFADAPDTVVLGVPRGGVVVAAEVARELGLPLDVVVAAKVGAPGNPEYAVGAVAPDGVVTPSPVAGYSAEELRVLAQPVHDLVRRRLEAFRGGSAEFDVARRTVLLVDDGVATGLTTRAAVEYLHRRGATRVVVAVPVAPPDSVQMLTTVADEVVVLESPLGFAAVGQFYRVFGQTEDAEVVRLIVDARATASRRSGGAQDRI